MLECEASLWHPSCSNVWQLGHLVHDVIFLSGMLRLHFIAMNKN